MIFQLNFATDCSTLHNVKLKINYIQVSKTNNIYPFNNLCFNNSKSSISNKVYEIKDNKKHWLNITVEEFVNLGYSWKEVYVVNEEELGWYEG